MGIIIRSQSNGEIRYIMKGADAVMVKIVEESDWLEEECTNLAREGLRTLVLGQRYLSEEQLANFQKKFVFFPKNPQKIFKKKTIRLLQAQSALEDRETLVEKAINSLEKNLELIGLTGVEDKLQVSGSPPRKSPLKAPTIENQQEGVKQTLEMLRCAGIKTWMLTGDKRETATCIGISSKLISRDQTIYHLESSDLQDISASLTQFSEQTDTVMIIDGSTLQHCLNDTEIKSQFFQKTKHAPSIICCRCSPTQKAEVVQLIKKATSEQVASIGDGGNDVSMIQAAHIGIGIEGKEGTLPSLIPLYSHFPICPISIPL